MYAAASRAPAFIPGFFVWGQRLRRPLAGTNWPVWAYLAGFLLRRILRQMNKWTPSTVPYGADQTVFLLVDRFGELGSVYRETEIERTDIETVISDLLLGN